jgi:phage FluMu protein Com
MKEVRCKSCNKLLFKVVETYGYFSIEIKCLKCKQIHLIKHNNTDNIKNGVSSLQKTLEVIDLLNLKKETF